MGQNLVLSLVRTWVPIFVGTLISWLASLGINVDTHTRESFVIVMTALVIGLYYTVVRLLERQFPQLGFLLGTPQQPVYTLNAPSPVVNSPTATGVQPVYPPDMPPNPGSPPNPPVV
jgi:hypothetical protein